MIIPFDQNKWERAGAAVKVDKYLRKIGCDPKLPVNISNILVNMGFDLLFQTTQIFLQNLGIAKTTNFWLLTEEFRKTKQNILNLKHMLFQL